MGSLLSRIFRKCEIDIETCEGWDQRMQEYQDKKEKIAIEKKHYQQLMFSFKVILYIICILILFNIAIIIFNFQNLNKYYLYSLFLLLCFFTVSYLYRRYFIRLVQKCNEKNEEVLESIKKHIDALSNVKACYPDISRLTLKYNIDSHFLDSKEVKSRNNDIKALLSVIRQLLELPLCKDCRYFTSEERSQILGQIPPHFASMFANVQPRKAEEISKPLDEKIMALIDTEEDAPLTFQKVELLENRPSENNEEVEIEEVVEEVKEVVKEDVKVEEIDKEEVENEDMNLRKRHVKDEE